MLKKPGKTLAIGSSRRWWGSTPFILALGTLFFIIWAASKLITSPYDGILNLHPTGLVREIDPNGPTFGTLKAGDTIVTIDGALWAEAKPLYNGKYGGEEVQLLVKRSGEILPLAITLVDPPLDEILERLMPLLVALIFLVVGVGVQTFKPPEGALSVFFIWCQVCAIILAAGAVSQWGPVWTSGLFNFLAWLLGPLSVHFHLRFPQTTTFRGQRLVLWGLYCIALAGGLPYLTLRSQVISSDLWAPQLLSAGRLFLALNLLVVVGLLTYVYRHAISAGVRGKIRIVVLGGVLGALPLVALIILPDALLQQTLVPYPFIFIFLAVLPLTYGYAIFRHHLIEIDRHVNRGATFILVYSILGSFYLFLYTLLHRWLPFAEAESPLIDTLIVFVLASLFVPLRHRVQNLVDTAFYGGWYDYRFAVTQITQGLEQITNLQELAQTISDRLVKTLRLEDTCVFLRDFDGDFSVIEVAPKDRIGEQPPRTFAPLPRSSLAYLLKMGEAVERSSLRQKLLEVTLTPEELQLLNSEQMHLWVPIIGHEQILGLLALGPKYGGDVFSSEDIDILRQVARQSGPIIESIHLLTQLRQYAAQLEKRVAERTAELYDAKERVEAILASVGDGVVVTNLDGDILIVNEAFVDQTGLPSGELVGQKYDTLLEGINTPETLDRMRRTLKMGETWTGELKCQQKDSGEYDIQLTFAPVRDQSGQIISYVGSQRDITLQRELDNLKDRFISDVSHELRTPATNLSLYLELLEYAGPEKRTKYMNVLREQTSLLVKLVEDILDLSRLAIGKTRKFEITAVDLNQVTQQVLTAHLPLAENSGITLVFEPRQELPYVRGEQNQLARVITNLLSNAIRYTFQGSVWVRTFERNSQVCLEVEDTGIGIEPDDIPHLFERFYRGQQVRQSSIHGTGLGLAIVKEIVDLHEGHVTIQSKVGKGSTFRVWLPAYQGVN